MKLYRAFRRDGWPLCPFCGADELQNPHLTAKDADGNLRTPTLEEFLASPLSCLACRWRGPNALRQLDAETAEHVLGWTEIRWVACTDETWDFFGFPAKPVSAHDVRLPSFTCSIGRAWEVVEKLRSEGWLAVVKEMPDGFPFYGPDDMDPIPEIRRHAYVHFQWIPRRNEDETRKYIHVHPHGRFGDSAAEAICHAALKVREAEADWERRHADQP